MDSKTITSFPNNQKTNILDLVNQISKYQNICLDTIKAKTDSSSFKENVVFKRVSNLNFFFDKEDFEDVQGSSNVRVDSFSNFEDAKIPKGNSSSSCLNESTLREFSQDPCVFKMACTKCNNNINNFIYKEHFANCKFTESLEETVLKVTPKEPKTSETPTKMKKNPEAESKATESDVVSTQEKDSSTDKPKKSRNVRSKAKVPVDVNKQCGVIGVSKNRCSRPLTCKTHSVEAKRKVDGRILPFDELLKQHVDNLEKIKMSKKTGKRKRRGAQPAFNEEEEDIFDSDEETKLILRALQQYTPGPLIVTQNSSEMERIAYYRQKYNSENMLDTIND